MVKLSNSPIETTVLDLEARMPFAFRVDVENPYGAPLDLTGAVLGFTLGLFGDPGTEPEVLLVVHAEEGVFRLQGDELDLDPGVYQFAITLRTNGYSQVLVKGEAHVRPNVASGAGHVFAGGGPTEGLVVVLAERNVVKVVARGGALGVGGGLDATGMDAGVVPTALGDGTWEWQALDLGPAFEHANDGDATTLALAGQHADDGDAAVLTAAKQHADAGAAAAVVAAAQYADDGDAGTYVLAQDYADQMPARAWLTQSLGTEDLDTILEPGLYHQNQSANATGARNYPTGVAGLLEVFSGAGGTTNFTHQRYMDYRGGPIFVRSRYTTTWYPWARLETTGDSIAATRLTGAFTSDQSIDKSAPRLYLRGAGNSGIYGADSNNSTTAIVNLLEDGRIYLYAGGTGTSTAAIMRLGLDGSLAISRQGSSTAHPLPFASAAGQASMSFSDQTFNSVSVTFPSGRFTQTPLVTTTQVTLPGGSGHLIPKASLISTTGMTVYLYTGNQAATTSGAVRVDWTATQMTPTSAAG